MWLPEGRKACEWIICSMCMQRTLHKYHSYCHLKDIWMECTICLGSSYWSKNRRNQEQSKWHSWWRECIEFNKRFSPKKSPLNVKMFILVICFLLSWGRVVGCQAPMGSPWHVFSWTPYAVCNRETNQYVLLERDPQHALLFQLIIS